jgi:hypothetical protein
LKKRGGLIQRHCELAVAEWGREDQAIRSMRARLMAYSKAFPHAKLLREKFQHVASLAEIDEIASQHMESRDTRLPQPPLERRAPSPAANQSSPLTSKQMWNAKM